MYACVCVCICYKLLAKLSVQVHANVYPSKSSKVHVDVARGFENTALHTHVCLYRVVGYYSIRIMAA